MMHQSKNNRRNRSRPNASRDTRPAQQTEPQSQSLWQRKYEHYRNLAQAAHSDDAVTCEHHWQYAEHFLRLINGSAT